MQKSPKIDEPKNGALTISALWTLSSNLVDRLIGLISMLCLARLLTPTDFGLVAIAGSFVGFAEMFNAFGFDWALVRHENPSASHYSSAWTLRVIFGLITVVLLFIIAPFAAQLLQQPALLPLIFVMAISLFVGSLENIGVVDFRRNFTFDREFVLRFWPKIISFVVAVTVAAIYHSYWALVFGSLVLRCMGVLMSYIMHPFRPKFNLQKTSELFSFSLWVYVNNVIMFLRNIFINLFTGHTFGPKAAGIYSLASEIAFLPITELVAPVNRAAFSKYSQNLANLDLFQEVFFTTASIVWMIALPAGVGIFFLAPEVVAILLGQQWTDAVNIVRVLAIGGSFFVLVANTQYVFMVKELNNIVFFLNIFAFVVLMGFSILLAPSIGLLGVAFGYLISTLLSLPIYYYLLKKRIGIACFLLCQRVWRVFIASGVMLLLLKLLFTETPVHSSLDAVVLAVPKIMVGSVIYSISLVGLWWIAGRPEGPERFVINALQSRWPW